MIVPVLVISVEIRKEDIKLRSHRMAKDGSASRGTVVTYGIRPMHANQRYCLRPAGGAAARFAAAAVSSALAVMAML